ncbi:MAG: HEAT repeat domain-containing protein [Candidatus Ozemobacteraceae bacterium]
MAVVRSLPTYKVVIPYSESSHPQKHFKIEYIIQAEDRETALAKAEREFNGYQQFNSAAWVRSIDRDQIRAWKISPDLPQTSQSIDELAIGLESLDPEELYRSLLLIGELEDATASSRIIPLLRHSDDRVAALAAETLGKIGDTTNLSTLINHFTQNTGSRLKASILSAVGKLARSTDPVQDILSTAMGDPDARVRANAVEVVERLRIAGSGRLLLPLLADEDNRVRGNVLKALWTSHDRRALQGALKGMLESPNPWMRASAAFVLQHIELEGRIIALGGLLSDPDPVVKNSAWRAFSQFHDLSCIPFWLDYLFHHRECDPIRMFQNIEQFRSRAIPLIQAFERKGEEQREFVKFLWMRLEKKILADEGWMSWLKLRFLQSVINRS